MATVGYVDSVDNGQIVGWIADKANLGGPCELECRDASTGESLKFSPHVYRPGIIENLGVVDAFGFAVPISDLPSNWATVDVLGPDGSLLNGGGSLKLGQRYASNLDQAPTQILLHIQKTAGTSLRTALSERLPDSRVCCLYGNGLGLPMHRFMALRSHQRRMFRLLVGHMYFGIHYFLPQDWRYITVLRHPDARVLSCFWHHHTYKTAFPEAELATVANEGLTEEFDNYQVRIVAGVSTETIPIGMVDQSIVDLALDNLLNHFSLVGFAERIDIFAQELKTLFRLQELNFQRLMAMKDGNRSVEPPDMRAVRYHNRFDQDFYDKAYRLFAK